MEVAEARFPLFFERHEFRPDSAGDGRYRGGVGTELTLRLAITEPAVGNTAGDGVRHPSYGILGGRDGARTATGSCRRAASASSRPRRSAFPSGPATTS